MGEVVILIIIITIGGLIIYYKKQKLEKEKAEFYFDNNLDIIKKYAGKLKPYSYRSYYIENLTRDCINEICSAKNRISIQPGSLYLSTWKSSASSELVTLAAQIEDYFEKEKQKLEEENQKLEKEKAEFYRAHSDFEKIVSERKEKSPKKFREIIKCSGQGNIYLEHIFSILAPNIEPWEIKEQNLIQKQFITHPFPLFKSSISLSELDRFNKEIENFNKEVEREIVEHEENSKFFEKIKNGFDNGNKEDVLQSKVLAETMGF
jgi:hypothetical protein